MTEEPRTSPKVTPKSRGVPASKNRNPSLRPSKETKPRAPKMSTPPQPWKSPSLLTRLPTRSSLIPMPTTCHEKARANLSDVGRCVTPGPGPSSPGRHTGNSSDVDNTVLPVTSSITLPESVMVAPTDLTAHSFSPSSAISPGNGPPSPLRPTQPGRTEPDPSTVERIVDIVAERIAQHFHQHDGRVTPPPVYREILHN